MNIAEGIFDSAIMRVLKVEVTSIPNVWRVSLPTRPWKLSAAEQERQSIVDKLSEVLPYKALWLSDWTSDERPGWRFFAPDKSLTISSEELSKGAWVLFFFEHSPGKALDTLIPIEPANPSDAARQIHDLGVAAAIWSWYDDTEWLVVFPGP